MPNLKNRVVGLAVAGAVLTAGCGSALAHPHVWVTAREELIFAADGRVEAIRNAWVFDEMYSAFVTEGLGQKGQLPTKDDLAPLAKTNVESLAEFDYFAHIKVNRNQLTFDAPQVYALEALPDKRVMLTFLLPLKTSILPPKMLSLQIYDPTFFVDFELDTKDPVELVNAPSGCSAGVVGANPLQEAETKTLSEAFFSGLSPGSDFGVKLAARVIVACP